MLLLFVTITMFVISMDIIFIARPKSDYSTIEKRILEQHHIPDWKSMKTGRYQQMEQQYVSDQFPFRTAWIRIKIFLDRLEGKRESNDVFLSKHGYLIQAFPDKDDKFEEKVVSIRAFRDAHKDINFVSLIAPTAISVLEKELPKNVVTGAEIKYIDALNNQLKSDEIQTIDVLSALKEASESTQVYYKTDHHWTTKGAYVAFREFAHLMGISFGEGEYKWLLVSDEFHGSLSSRSGFCASETDRIEIAIPKENRQFSVDNDTETNPKLYDIKKLQTDNPYDVFLGGNYGKISINCGGENKENLLILKDSYANCFIPFLLGEYNKIVIVDPRYFQGALDGIITSESITTVVMIFNANTFATESSILRLLKRN